MNLSVGSNLANMEAKSGTRVWNDHVAKARFYRVVLGPIAYGEGYVAQTPFLWAHVITL